MREGSLEAPTRHALDWQSPWFWDEAALEKEMERVFDICHGCRRCFNLCDSFPRLFDLIDNGPTGEVDGVPKEKYADVEQACTLCDMCFMTKCPYVPPHAWNVDFPHLMLRHRAIQARKHGIGFVENRLAETDLVGRLGTFAARLINWATDERNQPMRRTLENVAGIHHGARLPKQAAETFEQLAHREPRRDQQAAPAYGKRKAVLYATCFVNFHNTAIGAATLGVLAKNGVETEVVHPACCGMPKLELGDLEAVAAAARTVSEALLPWVDKGYDIVALTPSCALMLKFEWPLILPKDPASRAVVAGDLRSLRIRRRHRQEARPGRGPAPVEGGVSLHLACHARAQNMGAEGRGDAAPHPQDARRGDRALQRPWRHLGRAHREFRGRGEGRQARGPGRAQEQHQPRCVGMPAGRRAPGAGDGNGPRARPNPNRSAPIIRSRSSPAPMG